MFLFGPQKKPFARIFDLRSSVEAEPDRIWAHATAFASLSKCEKPLDKVYGLQSIFPPNCRIPVDYTRSLKHVFLATAKLWYLHDLQGVQRQYYDYVYKTFVKGCERLAIGMDLRTSELNSMYKLEMANDDGKHKSWLVRSSVFWVGSYEHSASTNNILLPWSVLEQFLCEHIDFNHTPGTSDEE